MRSCARPGGHEGTGRGDQGRGQDLGGCPGTRSPGVSARPSSEGDPVETVLEKALAAARKGSDSTIALVARKGRASYLGERSVGHRDPGSVVICLMFEAAHDLYRQKEMSA